MYNIEDKFGATDVVDYHWGNELSSTSYGAFGETSTCGDNPAAFPIRFSTKYHDVETDLYYYTKQVVAHEASHMFHSTQDYYLTNDIDKVLSNAYSWG